MLELFIREVERLIRRGRLSAEDGAALIDQANAAIAELSG
jgi:hypothetical protein